MNFEELKKLDEKRKEEEEYKKRELEEQERQRSLNLNLAGTVPQIEDAIRKGADIQSYEWRAGDYGRNPILQGKLNRAIIYNGYDFTENMEVLVSTGVYREALTCLAHKELFKSKDAAERLEAQCRELLPYVRRPETLKRYEHSREALKKNQEKQKKEQKVVELKKALREKQEEKETARLEKGKEKETTSSNGAKKSGFLNMFKRLGKNR